MLLIVIYSRRRCRGAKVTEQSIRERSCYFLKDLSNEQWFLINETIALPTKLPASVHTTLLQYNVIKDPYVGFRDVEYSWIADQDWVYQTTFKSEQFSLCMFTSFTW